MASIKELKGIIVRLRELLKSIKYGCPELQIEYLSAIEHALIETKPATTTYGDGYAFICPHCHFGPVKDADDINCRCPSCGSKVYDPVD